MYKKVTMPTTTIEFNDTVEGETIEQKIERIVNNKEPIQDGAPIIHTERKDGVQAGYDIRTDRFDVAIDAMDKVSGSRKAQREDKMKERQEALDELHGKKDGKNDGKNDGGGTETVANSGTS